MADDMKDHDIEDCTEDCFEKEGIIVPAKAKGFSDEDLAILIMERDPKNESWLMPLLDRLEASEAMIPFVAVEFSPTVRELKETWKQKAGK